MLVILLTAFACFVAFAGIVLTVETVHPKAKLAIGLWFSLVSIASFVVASVLSTAACPI
jgi:hypothetical protein